MDFDEHFLVYLYQKARVPVLVLYTYINMYIILQNDIYIYIYVHTCDVLIRLYSGI